MQIWHLDKDQVRRIKVIEEVLGHTNFARWQEVLHSGPPR